MDLHKSSSNSVFFDLQVAFPPVWRRYIVSKLYELGLRGNLPNILPSFLNDKTLMVRIQNVTPSPLPIENGVAQGEVFSVLLFLVAINDITKCIKFLLKQPLFADDYNIFVRSSNPLRAHRFLQQTLDSITTWSLKKGFRFPPSKSTKSNYNYETISIQNLLNRRITHSDKRFRHNCHHQVYNMNERGEKNK